MPPSEERRVLAERLAGDEAADDPEDKPGGDRAVNPSAATRVHFAFGARLPRLWAQQQLKP